MIIPYGISDFKRLREEGAYYVDRTEYIAQLEGIAKYILFLRPRRFGKSLWVSTLHHYYGLEYKEDFQRLFGDLYIGQHPTSNANSYLVLRLNFSGIKYASYEKIEEVFVGLLKASIYKFFDTYTPTYFDSFDSNFIKKQVDASSLLHHFLRVVRSKHPHLKIYVLIDEYDHFASALLTKNKATFLQVVGIGGFVQAFYESLKTGTESVIERIFITGVSPLMIDSLVSGFNIIRDCTHELQFHDMMGFREEEVANLLRQSGLSGQVLEDLLARMRVWYDGYRFHKKALYGLYNPIMVFHFVLDYLETSAIPEVLLDTNIASDYGKIQAVARLGGAECIEVLEKLIRKEECLAKLTLKFSLERGFTPDDFVSLLYYMGLLTIKGSQFLDLNFGMPNYVIEVLYYAYFLQLIRERTNLSIRTGEMNKAIAHIALKNDFSPFIELAEKIMQNLSNRDSLNFGEKHLQTTLFALLYPSDAYNVITEYEVGRQYIDVFLQKRDESLDINQFLLELKYLPKSQASQLEKVRTEGLEQVCTYASHERFKSVVRLHAYLIVFVGAKAEVVEEVVFS